LLALVADVGDARGELFDLEAEGAAPATLRRHLRLRAAFATAFGLVGGVCLGSVLSALVVDLVTLTANARLPEPPLLFVLEWPLVVLAAAGYIALAAALVGGATRAAFRAPMPQRPPVGSA